MEGRSVGEIKSKKQAPDYQRKYEIDKANGFNRS
jgi:hypothetical protein